MKRGCSRELYSSLKGGKRQWWRHQHTAPTALNLSQPKRSNLSYYLKSFPEQQDPLEGQTSYLSDMLLDTWFCGHLLKFGSNYVGVKFAYQVSHNTLNTHKERMTSHWKPSCSLQTH